ncbi:MAG: peptidase U34 [Clostridia bacterium]|nr:peptidase U34 [Clostridia bacterium]
MCDTMGFFHEGSAIFAKNSDRSPNEPQVLEYIPAKDHEETELKVTYTTIPQVPHTKAILISRPVWLWGAEMGVNEDGVCIGNEAVFTKGAYHKENDTLIGMDYLRLALERASTAKEAVDVITELLPVYGQGGNCAYDHKFYYDNSYLIMDRNQIFILETADKTWTCSEVERGSISNRLSQDKKFAKKNIDPLYSKFSGSADRLHQSSTCLAGAASVQDMMKALRTHSPGVKNPFAEGTVNSVCMHFGGVVGDHSTSSMVVELGADIQVWVTGTSTPCVSLFKPYRFGDTPTVPVYVEHDPAAEAYWRSAELFRRTLLCHELPPEFYAERDTLEAEFLRKAAVGMDSAALAKEASEADQAFYAKWADTKLKKVPSSYQFRNRWAKKTKVLKEES